MKLKLSVRVAHKRVFKLLQLDGHVSNSLSGIKMKVAVKMFCEIYNIPRHIQDHKKFLADHYLRIESSPIHKSKKLPVKPLPVRQVNMRRKKKAKKESKSHFSPEYLTYIKSEKWKLFSAAIKHERGNKCENCGYNRRLHAHHLTYERLFNELPQDIKILCHDCHEKVHGRKFKK